MFKKIRKNVFIFLFLSIFYMLSVQSVLAIPLHGDCKDAPDQCPTDSYCQYDGTLKVYTCEPLTDQDKILGKIPIPAPIQALGFGEKGISNFLNALIILIYMLAGVILVFMILWGAIQWLTSGGNKEAVQGAQNRITNAIIGIILMGITWAIVKLVGDFTGFKFF